MSRIKDIEQFASLFYKKASIESDMAKRVMLSIIPEVMDPLQRSNTMMPVAQWSVDITALKSAVRGAKDLIKYGARACFDELEYYPDKYRDAEGGDPDKIRQVEIAVRSVKQGRILLEQEKYIELLEHCRDAFNDTGGWLSAFGGRSWARIADTLFQIGIKYNELNDPAVKRDPAKELDVMKQIIVLMNVFDGLAHNTGGVLPKVLEMEYRDKPEIVANDRGGYIDRVQKIMDAKELDNPIEVYKQIEHIIGQSPYRMMFEDYIRKLRSHPDYTSPEDTEATKNKLRKIKYRKQYIQTVEKLNDSIAEAGVAVRTIISSKVPPPNQRSEFGISSIRDQVINNRKRALEKLYVALNQITSKISYFPGQIQLANLDDDRIYKPPPPEFKTLTSLFQHANNISARFSEIYHRWSDRDDYHRYQGGEYPDFPPELTDDMLKSSYSKIVRIAQEAKHIADKAL